MKSLIWKWCCVEMLINVVSSGKGSLYFHCVNDLYHIITTLQPCAIK